MNEQLDNIIKKKIEADVSYCNTEAEARKDKIWQQISNKSKKEKKINPFIYAAASIALIIGAYIAVVEQDLEIQAVATVDHGANEHYNQNCHVSYGTDECVAESQKLVCTSADQTTESIIKNGVNQGKFVNYLSDGTVQEKGAYKNGTKHGMWHYYNEKGELLSTVHFDNGVEISNSEQL